MYIFFHTKFLLNKDGDVDGADLDSSLSYYSAISLSISLHLTQRKLPNNSINKP